MAEAGSRSDAEAPCDWLRFPFHPRRGGVQRMARWKRATAGRVPQRRAQQQIMGHKMLRKLRQKRAVGDCVSRARVQRDKKGRRTRVSAPP